MLLLHLVRRGRTGSPQQQRVLSSPHVLTASRCHLSTSRIFEYISTEFAKGRPSRKRPRNPEDQSPLGLGNQRVNDSISELDAQWFVVDALVVKWTGEGQRLTINAKEYIDAATKYNSLRSKALHARQDMVVLRESYGLRGDNDGLVKEVWPVPPNLPLFTKW
jgi:hypothetical protein